MTDHRTIEDRLREEYSALLPDIRRVTEQLEVAVRYCVLPILRKLNKYEHLVVKSRIKECESAVGALRRRQEGATFDPDRPPTLIGLKDLAGVRVLAFPRRRVTEADQKLRNQCESWHADQVRGPDDQPLAFQYYGYCEASTEVRGEIQIMSMLIGLFWEVEHSAFYKLDPQLKGAARFWKMEQRRSEVYSALRAFEEEFEALISTASGGRD
jgi:ppGpp synthetase/RelA/SpoT-type nucleotidyltranferase